MKESQAVKVISGGTLVLPDRMVRGDLAIENGIISKIGGHISSKEEDRIDAMGQYILPGFIDIHHHGTYGFDFTFGAYDRPGDKFTSREKDFLEAMHASLAFTLSKGTTGLLLTTMAAPQSDILHSARMVRQYNDGGPCQDVILGINIEGSFLKLAAFAGAQNPAFFYPPSYAFIQELEQASGGEIQIVNIPPEHGSAGIELIEQLVRENMVVAGGHSGAYADEFDQAIASGLSLGVHFLNGPSLRSSKGLRGGGAEEAMLKSDDISLEIIADGYHVDPSYVRDVLTRKGSDRVIVITDSMFATGLPDLKEFTICGLRGAVSSDHSYLRMPEKKDTLFGSVLTMDRAFGNIVRWLSSDITGAWHRHHGALAFEEAMLLATKLCSLNPAKLLGIYESTETKPGRGSIELGKRADLLILQHSANHPLPIIRDVLLGGVKARSIEPTWH